MSTLRTFETKNSKKIVKLALPADVQARVRDLEQKPAAQVLDAYANSSLDPVKPIAGFNGAVKRLCDLVVSGLALIVLMPFLALLAILIKLDSTGPATFYQQRRGRNLENINVYKFRTMYQDYSTPVPTDKSFKQTQKDDPRITRIGAILRKTSLDELPQLLNVFEGSMSMVGPRPHPFPLDEQYKHIIPSLESRYVVKPGLTGWAQVNGLRGETVRVEDMVARIEHDRQYINNWSLWVDLKIIAVSAIKGWTHRNAY